MTFNESVLAQFRNKLIGWFGDSKADQMFIDGAVRYFKSALTTHGENEYRRGKEETLESLEVWLWDNGITHKESAQKLMAYIKSLEV